MRVQWTTPKKTLRSVLQYGHSASKLSAASRGASRQYLANFGWHHSALLPGPLLIWAIFLLTSVLTEAVSNNAVAVVVTPIAIGLAEHLGIDARALVVAVMIAASCSFATPIGYQTNTLIYGPGGYRFSDFLRVGVPLNLSIGLLASALIPFFFPL